MHGGAVPGHRTIHHPLNGAQMTPSDFVDAVRTWWYIPVITVIVAAAAFVVLVVLRDPATAQSSTSVRLAVLPAPENAQLPLALSPPLTRQQDLALSQPVVSRARDATGIAIDGMSVTVGAFVDAPTRVVTITALADDPDASARVASAMSDAYQDVRLELILADLGTRQAEILERLELLQGRLAERAEDIVDPTAPDPAVVASNELLLSQARALQERIREQQGEYGRLVADQALTDDAAFAALLVDQQADVQAGIDRLRARLTEVVAALPAGALGVGADETAPEPDAADVEGEEVDPLASIDVTLSVADAQARALRDQIDGLRGQYGALVAQEAGADDGARVIEVLPTVLVATVSRPLTFPALLLALFAVLAGLGLPLLLDRLDRTVRDRSQAAELIGAPVLGDVPRSRRRDAEPAVLRDPDGAASTAYRNIASTMLMAAQTVPESLLVIGVGRDAAIDVVALNLSISLARLGVRTSLVATQPEQHWVADICDGEAPEAVRGFRDLLVDIEDDAPMVTGTAGLTVSGVPHLRIIPPGTVPTTGVPARNIGGLLTKLAADGDRTTIIAGPSVIGGSDAGIYARQAGTVIWVVEERRTGLLDLETAAETIDVIGADSLGIVYVTSPS